MYKYLLLFLLCSIQTLSAQSLKIVRTDVDTSRSNFVTASYLFGVDIYVDSVSECNSAVFQLNFDQAQYIKYSGYSVGNLSDASGTIVIPQIDETTGAGTIYVGAIAGKPADSGGVSNPVIIHFDFVVNQNAVNNSNVTFSFKSAQAVVKGDSGATTVALNSGKTVYNIHSYVDVYPGDANNDGVVDIKDITQTSLYWGYGFQAPNSRSFKRRDASAQFFAQSSLAWDEMDATYADCDGDGAVNSYDILVVSLNFGRSRMKKVLNVLSDNKYFNKICSLEENEISLPITVGYNSPIVGMCGEIKLSNNLDDYELVRFQANNNSNDGKTYVFSGNKSKNSTDIALCGLGEIYDKSSSFYIGDLVLKKKTANANEPILDFNLKGLTPLGDNIDIQPVTKTDISENQIDDALVKIGTSKINFDSSLLGAVVKVYSLDGRLIESFSANDKEIAIDLPLGVYIFNVRKDCFNKTLKAFID